MSSLKITKSDNLLLSNLQVFILAGLIFGLLSNSKAKLLDANCETKHLLQPNLLNLSNNRYYLINNVNETGKVIYRDLDQSTSLISRKNFENKTVKDAITSNNITKKFNFSGKKVEEIRMMDKSSVLGAQKNMLSNPTNNNFNFDDYQFTHRKRRLPFKGQLNINVDSFNNTSEQLVKDVNWSNGNTSHIKRPNSNEFKGDENINFTNINNSIYENKFDYLIITDNSSIVPFKANNELKNKNNSDLLFKYNIFIDEESINDNLHESSLKAFYRDDELESIAADGKPPKENNVPQFILRQREGLEDSKLKPKLRIGKSCCDPEQAWADDVCEAKARLRIFIALLMVAAVVITFVYYLWNACMAKSLAQPCVIPDECPVIQERQPLPNNENTTC